MNRIHFVSLVLVSVFGADLGSLVTAPGSAAELGPKAGFSARFEYNLGRIITMAPAPGGGFYIGGNFTSVADAVGDCVVRFRSDGSPDETFVPASLDGGEITLVAPAANGKVVVAGSFFGIGGSPRSRLARLHSDGGIDPTFDAGSDTTLDVRAIAALPDGRLLIGGTFGLRRLLADGSVDPTFVPAIASTDLVSTIVLVDDGKIVIGGSIFNLPGIGSVQLVRLEENGSLDPGFVANTAGIGLFPVDDGKLLVLTWAGILQRLNPDGSDDGSIPVAGSFNADISAANRLSDGRIVVCGAFSYFQSNTTGRHDRRGAAILLPDGTLDPSFEPPMRTEHPAALVALNGDTIIYGGTYFVGKLSGTGELDLDFSQEVRRPATVYGMVPLPDGRWLVSGSFDTVDGFASKNLARLLPNGSRDGSFDTGTGPEGNIRDLVAQPDGKVIIAGDFYSFDGGGIPGLARLNVDGSRDETFVPDVTPWQLYGVALLPNGQILISGLVTTDEGLKGVLLRLETDGSTDPDFSAPPGIVPTIIRPQTDGTLVVAGTFGLGNDEDPRAIARLLADGALDTSFVVGSGFNNEVDDVQAYPGHRFVVVGRFTQYDGVAVPHVVRLEADGTRDPTFVPSVPAVEEIQAVAVRPDGSIWLAGGFQWEDIDEEPIVRLLANGQRDNTVTWKGASRSGYAADMVVRDDGAFLIGGGWNSWAGLVPGGMMLVAAPTPIITVPPQLSGDATAGGSGVTLEVDVVSDADVTYQWQADYGASGPLATGSHPLAGFVDVPGATSGSLSFPVPQPFHSGTYRVVISANGTSVTSDLVIVNVAAATTSPEARLLNLSTRALVQTGDNVLIPGFVIGGTDPKELLIRAVGPTLDEPPINFGGGTLPDPRMVLKRFNPAIPPGGAYEDVHSNEDWQNNANAAAITTTAAALGAFPLLRAEDAALLVALAPGQYTVIADDAAGGTGIALVELYDADPDGTGSRLVNISNRGFVGTGANVMIPGFVVSPEGPKTFLIRAVGPTLAAPPYNVAGTMSDPRLVVYQRDLNIGFDSEVLAQDNWGENPDSSHTVQVAQQVSAFALEDGSADAAFAVTLPPGVYTVVGSSADGVSTGVVLVEVYVVE